MQAKLRYCNANELSENDAFIQRLKEAFPDLEIEGISCLGYCALCAKYPYVLLNQQKITAETDDELFEIIAQKLQK